VPSACPTAIWLAAVEAAVWVTSPDTLPHWDITGTSILTCRGKERGGEQAASHWRQEGSGGGRRQAAAAVERREAWTAALIISGGCLSPAMALTSTACLTIHTDTFSGAAESRCLPLRSQHTLQFALAITPHELVAQVGLHRAVSLHAHGLPQGLCV
jgi:hypothetical protein